MRVIERLGWFLFRHRNYLFPIWLVAVLVIFPPKPTVSVPLAVVTTGGATLLMIGQMLRVTTIGLVYIRRGGKNGRFYANDLVTSGIFGHCRNPMYTGNILIATGFFALAGNVWALLVGGLASILIYAAIIYGEECYLSREFGAVYERYCADVPRWLPRLSGVAATLRAYRFDWRAVLVREYGTLFTTALVALVILGVKSARSGQLEANAMGYGITAVMLLLLYASARYLKKSRRLRAQRN